MALLITDTDHTPLPPHPEKTPQRGWREQQKASRSPSSVQTTSHNPRSVKPRSAGMPGPLLMQHILPGGALAALPAHSGGEGGVGATTLHGRLRQPGRGRRGRGCICCSGKRGRRERISCSPFLLLWLDVRRATLKPVGASSIKRINEQIGSVLVTGRFALLLIQRKTFTVAANTIKQFWE